MLHELVHLMGWTCKEMTMEKISDELIDRLLASCKDPQDIVGESGILQQLTKRFLERALEGELTDHLGYEKHGSSESSSGNTRNGTSQKTVKGDFGSLVIDVPRDRRSGFEPRILPKGQRRFKGFDERILLLYAGGMSIRDISEHIHEVYNIDLSPSLISSITDAVLEDASEWRTRPLESIYPVVWLDALVAKVRREGHVKKRTVYVALGLNLEGRKDVLGLWTSENEGAKFWLSILTELQNRGVQDILIACVDGLTGFPDAIESIYPDTLVQTCIVHLVRNSLKYVPWKQKKSVAVDLKQIYQASTETEAFDRLSSFKGKWDDTFPMISRIWARAWDQVTPMFQFSREIRKIIYTTNAVESLNSTLRRIIKAKGSFPDEESIMKILYLGIRHRSRKWTMPIRDWGMALNQFAIHFEGRLPL